MTTVTLYFFFLMQLYMPRPRKHPIGTTATQRVNASLAALKAAGGARKTWRLSPEANRALQYLIEAAGTAITETEIIERLLIMAQHEQSLMIDGTGDVSINDTL
jgi:hypothetical protein